MKKLAYEIGVAFDAIEAGRQRMAMFVTTFAELRDPRSWFHAIVGVAFDKGLVVTLFQDSDKKLGTSVRVFIGRDEDIWRVPALIAVRETGFYLGHWTRTAEARTNLLLGLSNTASRRRIAAMASGEMIYVALDSVKLAYVRAYGHRSFGTPDEAAGLTLLRREPSRVRRGEVLARCAVRTNLLGRAQSQVLTRARVDALHAAMLGRIQIRTTRGWQ